MTGDALSADALDQSGAGQAPLDLVILSGSPTAEELAAVTATLSAMIEEHAEDAALDTAAGQSAWQRSQRALRAPLTPGPGQWRGFNG